MFDYFYMYWCIYSIINCFTPLQALIIMDFVLIKYKENPIASYVTSKDEIEDKSEFENITVKNVRYTNRSFGCQRRHVTIATMTDYELAIKHITINIDDRHLYVIDDDEFSAAEGGLKSISDIRQYNPIPQLKQKPIDQLINHLIMKNLNIDLTTTTWKLSEQRNVRVLEMNTEHIQAVILVLANKLAAISSLKNSPAYEYVKDHKVDGRTPEAWIQIFTAILESRLEAERIKKAKIIKEKLDELKTTEERKSDLQNQLKELGFTEDSLKQLN